MEKRTTGRSEGIRSHMSYIAKPFETRIQYTESCWLWTGAITGTGYGWYCHPVTKQGYKAHRYAYELWVGPIPTGMTLDHLCRVRHCVKPTHLEPVTMRENISRGTAPPALHAKATHCINGHEYTPENTYSYKQKRRQCRSCRREQQRASERRKKEAGLA